MVYANGRIFTRRDERAGIARKLPLVGLSAEFERENSRKIMAETDKCVLRCRFRNIERPGWKTDAVKRLGEICFKEGKGADYLDYSIFESALNDKSVMVREAAAEVLEMAKCVEAMGVLLRATANDNENIRYEARKVIERLINADEKQIFKGQKDTNEMLKMKEKAFSALDKGTQMKITGYTERDEVKNAPPEKEETETEESI